MRACTPSITWVSVPKRLMQDVSYDRNGSSDEYAAIEHILRATQEGMPKEQLFEDPQKNQVELPKRLWNKIQKRAYNKSVTQHRGWRAVLALNALKERLDDFDTAYGKVKTLMRR